MTYATYLNDIAQYLEDNGITPVTIGGHYEHFENEVSLYPYGGLYPLAVITDDADPIGQDIQIRISNQSNQTATEQLAAITLLLRDVANTTIGETHFLYIQQKYGAFFVGKDNAGYYVYTISFAVLMQ